jgi:uncharacterized protein
MDFELDDNEARVLGALVEKDLTTPDQYPLSRNALITACNQKSNREPIMEMSDAEVTGSVASLVDKALATERSIAGSRVTRYAHRMSSGLGIRFDFSANALGVLTVLMLRGPQTPGEIRSRTARLCDFKSIEQVERALNELVNANQGPFAVRLERRPGFKEARFAHLMCGPVTEDMSAPSPSTGRSSSAERMERLESDVASLRAELDALKASLGE